MAQATFGHHSQACCSIPPIVASGYEAKGTYEEIGGLKTYVTGPADATKAIMFLMDIFGYFDQTLQGADILATSDDHNKYKVFMPRFYNTDPADISWFPPDTDEKSRRMREFFKANSPDGVANRLPDTVHAIKEKYPNIKSWGIVGFCWGGKITSLGIQEGSNTPFSAAAVCHPAMITPAEAESISIPFAMLASKDESPDQVKDYVAKLKGEKFTETYTDQIHGWMAARADLTNDKVKKEYERGYNTILQWFGKHIK